MEMKEEVPNNAQTLVQLQDIIGFLVTLDLNPKKTVSE
jgi:hypothetical protein